MPIRIDRLIIFGDSMSDIGNKRISGMGLVARALKLMRVNKIGRYSDRRNWTDFIWEWAGGTSMIHTDAKTSLKLTLPHQSLGEHSSQGAPTAASFSYANYSEGGALGASDRSAIGLGTFNGQYKKYKKDRESVQLDGNTLYIIWFGLNDLVTNSRDKTKMAPVAAEIRTICTKILADNLKGAHFLIANLPNPQHAVRYMDKETSDLICGFQTGAFEFNFELARQVKSFGSARADLVDVYTPLEAVNDNPGAFGQTRGAQPHGVPVRYDIDDSEPGEHPDHDDPEAHEEHKPSKLSRSGKADTASTIDYEAVSHLTATSDAAHPTEASYRLIARVFAAAINARYDLGQLRSNPNAKKLL